jgi:hypothetical protein
MGGISFGGLLAATDGVSGVCGTMSEEGDSWRMTILVGGEGVLRCDDATMMGELRIGSNISAFASYGGGGGREGEGGEGAIVTTFVGAGVLSWASRGHSITVGDSSSPFIRSGGRRVFMAVVSVAVVVTLGIASDLMSRCCVALLS